MSVRSPIGGEERTASAEAGGFGFEGRSGARAGISSFSNIFPLSSRTRPKPVLFTYVPP